MNSNDNKSVLPNAALDIKCLICKSITALDSVDVQFEPVFKFDRDEFEHYWVEFHEARGNEPVHLQDLLCCQPVRCQVRGTMPDGVVFAFPRLDFRGSHWTSYPDRHDTHFAIRGLDLPIEHGVSV